MKCEHEKFIAKEIPLSDGRRSLREFCAECGSTKTGTPLGYALPMVADKDLMVATYKHKGMTLGEIMREDKEYIRWLVLESKSSDRIKKSAARLYFGCGYIPPVPGNIYDRTLTYDPSDGQILMEKMKSK